ncbi:MAG: NAD(P)H-dependent glycerol-3-phosphate dehydrogenase [Verrucomicrobiota bacterium]
MSEAARVRVIGQGAWGRALGHLLERRGHRVSFQHHTEADRGWDGSEVILVALPVQHIRETLGRLPSPEVPVLSLSKGMEIETGRRVSQIIDDVWGGVPVGALSGPTFAAEVVRDLPAVCVVAAGQDELARRFQELIHQPTFRLYRSTDLTGVELGGALKNIYALVGGICRRLELGENAMAGVLTRCLAEMKRIGVRLGGQPETFAGLSGMGDLLLTAMSEQSRNFRTGQMVAEGKSLEEILPALGGVAEGVATAKSVHQNPDIPVEDKPIATQIYDILYSGKSVRDAIRALLERDPKAE